jgi:Zn-dependent protease with chaperone function
VPVVVLAHLGLAVLAVVEYARLAWIRDVPFEATAVTVVAGSGLLAVAGAVRVVWSAVHAGRALRGLLRSARRPLPARVATVAAELGTAGRVDLVATPDAFAVTHGLVRPRILLSSGLVDTLSPAELLAVLRHEQHHVARRDPLRLLAVRVLAGYGWYLPALEWGAERFALRRELAADRAASSGAGVAALAGALLKLADVATPAAVAAVNPKGSLPARIAQLEGEPLVRRPRLGLLRAGASLASVSALLVTGMCCAGMASSVLAGSGA